MRKEEEKKRQREKIIKEGKRMGETIETTEKVIGIRVISGIRVTERGKEGRKWVFFLF